MSIQSRYTKYDEFGAKAVENYLDTEVMNNFVEFLRQFYPQDIFFLMSFPRSGNGWIRYLVTEALLISAGIDLKDSRRDTYHYNNVNAHCIVTKSGKSFGIEELFADYYAIDKKDFKNNYFQKSYLVPDNVYIKTHHLVSRKDVKTVHLYRHPKDVCISFFCFTYINNKLIAIDRNSPDFIHFFKQAIKSYLNVYHKILDFYKSNASEKILLLRMEDMVSNSGASFDILLDFFNINITAKAKNEILARNPKLQTTDKMIWTIIENLWDEELDTYAKNSIELFAVGDK